MNSENEVVNNAQVFVDGKRIPFDAMRNTYFLADTFQLIFNFTAYCEGYDTVNYSRNNLQSFHHDFFMGNLWLIRTSEKFFYASDLWLKMPYTPHPDKLLVILNPRNYPKNDSLRIRFENEIEQYGLKVNNTFIAPPTDPIDLWKYNSYVGLKDRLIIQKEDGSDFNEDYCQELSYLRQLEMVYSAGPLLSFGHKYNIVTYNNAINVYNPSRYYKSEEIDQILKQIDNRFYYDEKTQKIILPMETNEIVPQIMEKLKEAGFKGQMNMEIFFMVVLN